MCGRFVIFHEYLLLVNTCKQRKSRSKHSGFFFSFILHIIIQVAPVEAATHVFTFLFVKVK